MRLAYSAWNKFFYILARKWDPTAAEKMLRDVSISNQSVNDANNRHRLSYTKK